MIYVIPYRLREKKKNKGKEYERSIKKKSNENFNHYYMKK